MRNNNVCFVVKNQRIGQCPTHEFFEMHLILASAFKNDSGANFYVFISSFCIQNTTGNQLIFSL